MSDETARREATGAQIRPSAVEPSAEGAGPEAGTGSAPDPFLDALTGGEPNERTTGVMPDFVRRAIEAQGAVDPDEVERLAATVDLDTPRPGDVPLKAAPEPVQDPLDLGIPIPTKRADV